MSFRQTYKPHHPLKKMNINSTLKEVLTKISLTNEEEVKLETLAKEIIAAAKKKNLQIISGGSLAKKTLIKKAKQDIDLFAIFKDESDMKSFEKKIQSLKLNAKKIHGSRDYFQITKDNITVEIIPVMKITDPKKASNITDFSLSHVKYVKDKISNNKKLSDDIKLAKTFCHAQGCYGAESFIGGFSGYALEVLIIHFGSFKNFLKGIQKKKILDPEKHFKSENEIMNELNESKIKSPIIVIDPTYKYRNVCASLRQETFDLFIKATKKFLKSPSSSFFEKSPINLQNLESLAKKNTGRFLVLNLETDRQEGDIAATKMRKFFDFLIDELERKEQKVLQKEFVYEDGQTAKGYLVVKEKQIIIVQGPEAKRKEAAKSFKKVNKKVFKKGKNLYAKKSINILQIIKKSKEVASEIGVTFTGKIS